MDNNNKKLLQGIGLMLAAMSVVPMLDVLAKLLSESYSSIQISWARFVFNALWLLPILHFRGLKWWTLPPQPLTHVLRSLMLTGATVLFFIAIKTNPIPNALTLLFVSPLVVAMLAPTLLGEKFDLYIGVGVVVGFAGVVVVLQPDTEQFQPSLLYALGSGFCYALYIIATRKLSHSGPPLLTLFYTALGGAFVLSFMVAPSWATPSHDALIMMAAMGLVAALAHFLLIKAFEHASASELSPFNYFEIVVAILLSYIVFDFLPTIEAVMGLAVIASSGLFVSWRAMKNSNKAQLREVDVERL